MIKLSNHDVDVILDLALHAWDNTKGFTGNKRKEYFKEEFNILLKYKQSGLRENVCNNCLGTGYNEK